MNLKHEGGRVGEKFRREMVQLMKFAWQQNIANLAPWNSGLIEEIDLDLHHDILSIDDVENDLVMNTADFGTHVSC